MGPYGRIKGSAHNKEFRPVIYSNLRSDTARPFPNRLLLRLSNGLLFCYCLHGSFPETQKNIFRCREAYRRNNPSLHFQNGRRIVLPVLRYGTDVLLWSVPVLSSYVPDISSHLLYPCHFNSCEEQVSSIYIATSSPDFNSCSLCRE